MTDEDFYSIVAVEARRLKDECAFHLTKDNVQQFQRNLASRVRNRVTQPFHLEIEVQPRIGQLVIHARLAQPIPEELEGFARLMGD